MNAKRNALSLVANWLKGLDLILGLKENLVRILSKGYLVNAKNRAAAPNRWHFHAGSLKFDVPPLRERAEDITFLVSYFAQQFAGVRTRRGIDLFT